MASVKVKWTLPTTRASGKPLALADVAGVKLQISANGGQTYTDLPQAKATDTERLFQDLEPGEWRWRGAAVDTKGRTASWSNATFVIEDTSPPGVLPTFVVELQP